ncbi:aryl-alcohol dehydrogenase [Pseudomonas syringae]|nr:aryl-alcohol dehydrogenase [Pseudomonas syringae]
MGVVGASHLDTLVSFDVNELLINGKSIRGICDGDSVPQKFIPDLVRLLMQGRFPFDRMVKFYPFDKINEAAADSEKGTTLKLILIIDPTFPMSH